MKKKYTKIAVIPTTAGSGAEVTSNAVIYVDGIKHSFESELLIPDNFFLIPEFLISAPNKIKASAGFDAIAQALESLISKKSNDQSIEYASKSLKVSISSYISFLNEPNLKNATEMSIAANLAGHILSKIFLGIGLMLLLDAVIEPIAPLLDFWEFIGGLAPAQNYIGWFLTALPLHLFYHLFKVEIKGTFTHHLFLLQIVFFTILLLQINTLQNAL